jgi:hypothetical protein
MTPLERAVLDIATTLESFRLEYAIVGGIANAIWGEPRATIDVDVTVSINEEDLPTIVPDLAGRFRPAVADPVAFVQQTRVLPLDTSDGVRIDVIFALLPFELDAIHRAQDLAIAGRKVRVVTPEDLIVMKIISDRPKDVDDAEAIVRRRGLTRFPAARLVAFNGQNPQIRIAVAAELREGQEFPRRDGRNRPSWRSCPPSIGQRCPFRQHAAPGRCLRCFPAESSALRRPPGD